LVSLYPENSFELLSYEFRVSSSKILRVHFLMAPESGMNVSFGKEREKTGSEMFLIQTAGRLQHLNSPLSFAKERGWG
jgi:hypothetical protein